MLLRHCYRPPTGTYSIVLHGGCNARFQTHCSLSSLRPRTCPTPPSCCAAPPNLQPPQGPDWRDTAEPFVAAMQAMTKEGLLEYLNRKGVPAARELQQQQEESQQMQAASRAALKDAASSTRSGPMLQQEGGWAGAISPAAARPRIETGERLESRPCGSLAPLTPPRPRRTRELEPGGATPPRRYWYSS